jgi:hypothetical protein
MTEMKQVADQREKELVKQVTALEVEGEETRVKLVGMEKQYDSDMKLKEAQIDKLRNDARAEFMQQLEEAAARNKELEAELKETKKLLAESEKKNERVLEKLNESIKSNESRAEEGDKLKRMQTEKDAMRKELEAMKGKSTSSTGGGLDFKPMAIPADASSEARVSELEALLKQANERLREKTDEVEFQKKQIEIASERAATPKGAVVAAPAPAPAAAAPADFEARLKEAEENAGQYRNEASAFMAKFESANQAAADWKAKQALVLEKLTDMINLAAPEKFAAAKGLEAAARWGELVNVVKSTDTGSIWRDAEAELLVIGKDPSESEKLKKSIEELEESENYRQELKAENSLVKRKCAELEVSTRTLVSKILHAVAKQLTGSLLRAELAVQVPGDDGGGPEEGLHRRDEGGDQRLRQLRDGRHGQEHRGYEAEAGEAPAHCDAEHEGHQQVHARVVEGPLELVERGRVERQPCARRRRRGRQGTEQQQGRAAQHAQEPQQEEFPPLGLVGLDRRGGRGGESTGGGDWRRGGSGRERRRRDSARQQAG